MKGDIRAEVIECPGRLGDSMFEALRIDIEGLETPFVMTLALPAVSCRALAGQARPGELYRALAAAITAARATVRIEHATP